MGDALDRAIARHAALLADLPPAAPPPVAPAPMPATDRGIVAAAQEGRRLGLALAPIIAERRAEEAADRQAASALLARWLGAAGATPAPPNPLADAAHRTAAAVVPRLARNLVGRLLRL